MNQESQLTNERGAADRMELGDYVRVVSEQKWTVAIATVLVVAFAMLFSWLQPTLYRAEARVAITPLPLALPGFVPTLNIDTESQRAESLPVALLVKEDLGTEQSPKELLKGLNAQAEPGTEVLGFVYSDEDPAFAQSAANSFAESYMLYRRDQVIGDLAEAQGAIQERIEETAALLDDIEDRIADARRGGDDSLVKDLEAERGVLLVRLGLLRNRLGDIEPESIARLAEGEIIEPASRPTSPASPNYKRTGVLALVLGLVVGTGAAFLRDYLGAASASGRRQS